MLILLNYCHQFCVMHLFLLRKQFDQHSWIENKRTNISGLILSVIEMTFSEVSNIHQCVCILCTTKYGIYFYFHSFFLQNNMKLFTMIEENTISMFVMVPQYIVITVGEILFSITGLSFGYSQVCYFHYIIILQLKDFMIIYL